MKKTYILTLLGVMFLFVARGQTFFDNFDSYTVGDYLGKSNPRWTTWSNNPGGSDDIKIANSDAFSGKNSIAFSGGPGPNDVVLPFIPKGNKGYNQGYFIFKQMMKISNSSSAYFNFQADSAVGIRWAVEVTFGTTGSVTFSNTTSGTMMTTTYPQGNWFEFMFRINLDANRWEVFINGVSKGYFSNSINQVSYLDLYPSASTAAFWVDNVYFKYLPHAPNDAGINTIDSPATYCSGSTRNVYATVKNYGTKALDSVTINWSVNHVKQTSIKYKTKIDTINSSAGPLAKVKLGSFLFKSAADTIYVWTTLPNGVADTIPFNDTLFIIKKPSAPPIADAGDDKDICPGTKVRIGTTGTSGNTYSWTSRPAGYTASTFNADVIPAATTTYILKVTNTGTQCYTIDSVVITIKPAPIADAGKDMEVCTGDSVRIGAIADTNLSYSWVSDIGGFKSTLPNPYVKPTQTTNYTVTVTNKQGCSDDSTMTVTVNALPSANAGSDQNICKGSSATIGKPAVSGNTYSWRSVPAGFTSTTANPVVTPQDSTLYILTVTNSSGCKKEDEVKINVSPLPVADAGDEKSICLGGSVKIGSPGKTGQTYSWTSNPAGFTSFSAEPTVTPTVSTMYKLLVRGNGCTSEDSVLVMIIPQPKANAGSAQSVCSGDSVMIGTAEETGVTYSWTSNPAGFTSSDAQPWVKPSVNTTYTVVATNTDGCSADSKVTVTVKDAPKGNAGQSKTICKGESTQIGGTAVTGNTYSWTSDPAGFTSSDPNPTVTPTGTTKYKLVITNAGGCTALSEATVTISNPVAGFTMTGGLTVTFTAKVKGYAKYEWSFGDTKSDTGYTVTHTYGHDGKVNVKMKVTTVEGCVDDLDTVVTVNITGIRSAEEAAYNINIYPNPFTSGTTVNYTLPERAQVNITLVDITGKQVASLVNATQPQGEHAIQINAEKYNLKSGIYFVQLRVAGSGIIRKIVKVE